MSNIKVSDETPVGIDLGTTFSCVGIWRNDQVEIIVNSEGLRTTPSYVSYKQNEILIGKPAQHQLSLNPSNTIYDMKRLIGNKNVLECIKRNGKYWTFKINENPEVEVNIDGQTKLIKPEEISAQILMKLKQSVENVVRKPIKNIVLTVPAYFDEDQKNATIKAAEIAGLHVLELISEPSAAAYAYGFDQQKFSDTNLLVFDLGGGTLDVVIVKVKDGIFNVVAIGGDTLLGGRDFDNTLMDYFANIIEKKYKKKISENVKIMQKLLRECIDLKHMLTATEDANLYLGDLFPDIDEDIKMDRVIFDQLCFHLFHSIEMVILGTLKEADMSADKIDEIILVGGSCRLAAIKKLVLKIFPEKKLNFGLNPDEAIAYGATLRATQIFQQSKTNIILNESNAKWFKNTSSTHTINPSESTVQKQKFMFYVKGFHYKESDLLGSGSFGKVYKSFNPDTKQSSAIKKIQHGRRENKQELEIFQKLQSIENENLIKLIDFDIHDNFMFLIMELGDLTLREYLIEHGHLNERVIHQFFRDIANGLRALKNANIIHRDIKPENILLCNKKSSPTPAPKDYIVKLADFGTSRFLQLGELAQTVCGTIAYMAPEIQLRKRYNNSADLWSTGLLLLRCIAGADCFRQTISVMEDDLDTFFLEYRSLPLHFNSDCEISNGLKKIIEGLLIVKPDERLNFERFFRYFSEEETESSWTNSLNIKVEEDIARRINILFTEIDEAHCDLINLKEKRKLSRFESEMSNLRSLLVEYASQISTGNSVAVRELNKAINDFMDSDFCPTSIQQFIEEHYEWQEKMNYVDDLLEQGVLYVGKNDSLETSRRRLECQECYIFYYSQEGSTRALTGMKELFYQLALLNRLPCIAVDIDIHRELAEREGVPAGPRICLYSNGMYKSMSINSEKQMPKYEPCKEQIELIEKLVEDREISECTKQIMLSFDRADFCPLNPYEDRPQQVGFNTTISAPHMHALTLEFFTDKINFDSKILDVGCGTGYLTTCFAKMIGINGLVIGIDHIPELVEMAIKNIKKHHSDLYTSEHIKIVEGDGRNGYTNNAPYDIINVGAAAEKVPSGLINQLKVGGYLIMPVGPPGDQQFMQYFKESTNKIVEKKLLKVRYVALTSKEEQLGNK